MSRNRPGYITNKGQSLVTTTQLLGYSARRGELPAAAWATAGELCEAVESLVLS